MRENTKPLFVRFLPEEIAAIDILRAKQAAGFGIARSRLVREAMLAYLQKHKVPIVKEGVNNEDP